LSLHPVPKNTRPENKSRAAKIFFMFLNLSLFCNMLL
jgi:hypothetical protein